MTVPANPSVQNLIEEAFNKVGIANPSTDQKSRATDYFLEEIKNDLWTRAERRGNTRFRSLQTFEVQITTIGKSKYDFASDFDEEISITLLDGTHTGTAQAGAANAITLESGEDVSEADAVGEYLLLTSGTGADAADNLRQITAYDTSTLIATVDRNWTTNPDNTSVYLIANEMPDLDKEHIEDVGGLGGANTAIGKPSSFARLVEGVNERFILDKPPDKATYGLLIRYYANIHEIDLTGTLYARLLQNWRWVFTYGVAARIAEDEDDNKYGILVPEYETRAESLLDKEVPYDEEWTGFEVA